MQEVAEADEAASVVRQVNDKTSDARLLKLRDGSLSVGLELVEVTFEGAYEHLAK